MWCSVGCGEARRGEARRGSLGCLPANVNVNVRSTRWCRWGVCCALATTTFATRDHIFIFVVITSELTQPESSTRTRACDMHVSAQADELRQARPYHWLGLARRDATALDATALEALDAAALEPS